MSSRFSSVKNAPSFELNDLTKWYHLDNDKNKINLSQKNCIDNDGSVWIMKLMRERELELAMDPKSNHEYYHPLGHQQFRDSATRFLLGEDNKCIKDGRAFGIQSLGGTSALRLALEFLSKQLGFKRFYLAAQTSDDQKHVFLGNALPIELRRYHFWDATTKTIGIKELIDDLSRAPEESVIVLQMCSHNPTGLELTKKQWMKIAEIMQERKLFPLFDASYQGLSSGDPEKDAWPVRYFAEKGFELLCAQSFSTAFGLYDCRIGNITFIVNDVSTIPGIQSESTWNFYNIYGTPAQHGAEIVRRVLEDKHLHTKWLNGIKMMNSRLCYLRSKLSKALMSLDSKLIEDWSHIAEQKGLFCYTGLSEEQVDHLRKYYHIYMEKNGCINVSALTNDSIDYVANAIHQTLEEYSLTQNNIILKSAYAG